MDSIYGIVLEEMDEIKTLAGEGFLFAILSIT
jgi:hypothetical protein